MARTKPPRGTLVDWSRPTAWGLIFAETPGPTFGPSLTGPTNATPGQSMGSPAFLPYQGDPTYYSSSNTGSTGAYWTLPSWFQVNTLTDFTVSVRAALVSISSYAKLLSIPANPGTSWPYPYTSIGFYFQSNQIHLDLSIGGSAAYSSVNVTNPADSNLSNWTAVRKGGSSYFYRDGSLIGSTSLTTGAVSFPSSGGTICSAGRSYQTQAEGFQGYLSGVAIWNRGLAQSDVAELAADPWGYLAKPRTRPPILSPATISPFILPPPGVIRPPVNFPRLTQ